MHCCTAAAEPCSWALRCVHQSAKIEGYPVFPGVEADYLRSQITLITSDTGIAPAGFYKLEDDWEEDPEDKTPGKGCCFLVFVPIIREIRDFYREM
eukprot:SAG31_NODE_1073_length_10065_cov_2.176701_6_plen_96_part_00